MGVFLGLLVAVSFGTGDFLGGRASRHATTAAVLLLVQIVAVIGGLALAALVSAEVTGGDVAYAAAAGAVNVTGLGLLFYGLAHARVSVVAPLTAVVGAVVPVGWALLRGERPSLLVLAGAVCAVVAGALIAREPEEAVEPDTEPARVNAVAIAIAAGALLGTSLILYAQTSEDSGFWPVFTGRVAGLALVSVVALAFAARRTLRFPSGAARGFALGTGVLDVVATALLLAAVRRGLLVAVAPFASLAPAFTVVWAWALLHERVARTQLAGLVLAGIGLVLVAAG